MIRVVMRHINEVQQRPLGDFPPDQIDGLLNLLGGSHIWWDDSADDCDLFGTQFITADTEPQSGRMVLEILVDS